ncbi:MAG: hypothetical protein OEV93_01010 [Candidatus Moranbacteria bacterium]|nr:hypothetical protein [Candidatus Moranbacteria bacterium]
MRDNYNKKFLSKLAALNNEVANKQLVVVAVEFRKIVSKLRDNDKIYDTLDLLEEFVHRATKQAFEIIDLVMENKYPTKKYKSKFGEYSGKSYEDLVLKCVGILEIIRYYDKDIFMKLIDIQERVKKYESVQKKIKEVLEKYSKYNYHAISNPKIGYGVQRKILDEILKWTPQQKKKIFDLIEIVTREFLKSSFEGTSMKDYNTMVFQRGSLGVNKFLKNIRRETIDMLVEMFEGTRSENVKLRILNILNEATRKPMEGYDDKMVEMVEGDVEYLVKIYDQFAFGKNGKISSFPIVKEIEDKLYFLKKAYGENIPEIELLKKRINESEEYQFLKLLVKDHNDLAISEKDLNDEIKELVNSIDEDDLGRYCDALEKLSSYVKRRLIDEWELSHARKFCFELAKNKPDLAGKILSEIIFNGKELNHFVSQFLCGFRAENHTREWDKFIGPIVDKKNIEMLKVIPWSVSCIVEHVDRYVRENDIRLLNDIVKGNNKFSFLRDVKNDVSKTNFHVILIEALAVIWKKDKKRIEKIIIEELKQNSEDQGCISALLNNLDFSSYRKVLDLLEFSDGNIKFIIGLLVEIDKLDHRMQELMVILSEKYYENVMNVFMKRINNRQNMKEKGNYEAVPYHFNQELKEAIVNGEEYEKFMLEWIELAKKGSYIFCMDTGRLLRRVDGVKKEYILKVLDKNSTEKEIENILKMFTFDVPDYEILIGIIKMTDKKEIWGNIEGVLAQTGVVSGEHGISDSYKRKVKDFEKYKKDKDENVKKFAEGFVDNMNQRAKEERKREDEEIALRKIEFEG